MIIMLSDVYIYHKDSLIYLFELILQASFAHYAQNTIQAIRKYDLAVDNQSCYPLSGEYSFLHR